MEILFLKILDREFGLNKKDILEVSFPEKFFDVPGVSEAIKGIINHKGHPIVVINLPYLMNMDDADMKEGVVICKTSDYEFGILVNEIHLVHEISETDIQTVKDDLFEGLIEINGKKCYILSLQKLLNHEKIKIISGEKT